MASQWFVRGGAKVYGPLDDATLRRLVAEGKINEGTDVATESTGPWHSAAKVRGLFPSYQKGLVLDGFVPASTPVIASSQPRMDSTERGATASPRPYAAVDPTAQLDVAQAPALLRITKSGLAAILLANSLLVALLTAGAFFLRQPKSDLPEQPRQLPVEESVEETPEPPKASPDKQRRAKYASKCLEFFDELRSAAKLLAESPSPQSWTAKVEAVRDRQTRIPDCPEEFRKLHGQIEKAWTELRTNGGGAVVSQERFVRDQFYAFARQAREVMAKQSATTLDAIKQIEAEPDYERLVGAAVGN